MTERDRLLALRAEFRRRREELGLGVTEASELSGVGPSKIARIENGDLDSPRLLHIVKLATLYGMPGNEVFALVDVSVEQPAHLREVDQQPSENGLSPDGTVT